ncbi:MAG TPA: FtsX-like permease family protein [Candidatus Nanoarchaeia archaeon]|nr:FtsX-like permease family protein [Candidatus Nanoarchaeia archaeon]
MNVVTRGIRNAFRNSVRTFSIIVILGLSIGLALTMLVARQAVEAKIASVKSSIGNTITVSPAGARGFNGGGEPLTEDQMAKVRNTPHVTSVTESLQDRFDSTNSNLVSAIEAGSLGRRNNGGGAVENPNRPSGNFTPPVFVTGVNSLTGAALLGGGDIKLTSGQQFDPTKDANVALMGQTLATKNNLSIGSTFQAYGKKVTVDGIFDSGNTFSNNAVVMPLVTLQKLSSQAGQVSQAVVTVDSITNVDATTKAIQSSLGTDVADVTSQQDASSQALTPLENIKNISLYSLIGAVGAGAVIILLTMLMIVRERRREIGVLKAIGASNLKVMFQFMSEAVTFTLISAVVGLGIGVAASNPVTKLLVSSSANSAQMGGGGMGRGFGRGFARVAGVGGQSLRNVQAVVGWSILLYGLGAALLIALVGSALPALLIAKIRPAEVMRAE